MKKLASLFLASLLAAGLVACGGNPATSEAPPAAPETTSATSEADPEPVAVPVEHTIKIGVVGENNEHWAPVITALAAEGIAVELVKFSDYTLPNTALAEGEIDLNSFQHYAFLANEIEATGYELTVIADTIIAPLGLYSEKIASLDEIVEGDKIAIPNDATNGGRSLRVLEAAGLITVDPAAGYTPTLKDITENPLNLEFVEVEAAQTASLLPDVAAAIINGGHAVDNGFFPAEDSIYLEEVTAGSDNPYINIIVARTEDKDNALYLRVVEAFQTDEVAAVLEDAYLGSYIPAWR